jgi:hypothetical protein
MLPFAIVCKVGSANGRPAVKLSDNPMKSMGPETDISRSRRVFARGLVLGHPLASQRTLSSPQPTGNERLVASGTVSKNATRPADMSRMIFSASAQVGWNVLRPHSTAKPSTLDFAPSSMWRL